MDYTHTSLSLVGIHEPEFTTDIGPDGNKHQYELPGFFTIGTEVDGVFVPLVRIKAGKLMQDIERAKASGYTSTSQSDADAQAATEREAALEARIAALEAAQSAHASGEGSSPPSPAPTPSG